MAPVESVDFYCVQFFYHTNGSDNIQAFYLLDWDHKSLSLFFFFFFNKHVLTKIDVQLESCELSFIWGKMKTETRGPASQRALRDCSKAAVGKSQYIKFGEGGFNTMKHSFY